MTAVVSLAMIYSGALVGTNFPNLSFVVEMLEARGLTPADLLATSFEQNACSVPLQKDVLETKTGMFAVAPY